MRFQVSPVFLGRWTLKSDTEIKKNDNTIDRGRKGAKRLSNFTFGYYLPININETVRNRMETPLHKIRENKLQNNRNRQPVSVKIRD